MEKVSVYLNDVNIARKFVKDMGNIESDIDLLNGNYVVDAKSILGIFSLDLSRPVIAQIHKPTKEILEIVKKYEK